MKTIATLQNGQVQTAEVTWAEFQELDFKYETAKNLVCNATEETVDYIKVSFDKAGQVVNSKAFLKPTNGPTSIFKKEAIKKNGQLTKKAIAILKEVAK
ncbi:TPA: hypothetical protein TY768_000944 [Streptococcus suis]|nr:hypothetical protein [Streptococcus suis]